jgi:hypothetical protein
MNISTIAIVASLCSINHYDGNKSCKTISAIAQRSQDGKAGIIAVAFFGRRSGTLLFEIRDWKSHPKTPMVSEYLVKQRYESAAGWNYIASISWMSSDGFKRFEIARTCLFPNIALDSAMTALEREQLIGVAFDGHFRRCAVAFQGGDAAGAYISCIILSSNGAKPVLFRYHEGSERLDKVAVIALKN